MFANIVRKSLCSRGVALSRTGFFPRRQFSIVSIHTNFPATLHRFQIQRSSGLSDYEQSGDVEDAVKLSEHGLVCPRVSNDLPFTNGAVFMPNTFTMQEWVRTNFDDYAENLGEGQSTSDATILSVRKGTPVPKVLTLLREDSTRFSLQPSHPMSIQELNDILSEFYHQNATFTDAEKWMDNNEYHESTADEDIEKWMCQ